MLRFSTLTLAITSCLVMASTEIAHGFQLQNGSFETNDSTGWTTRGQATVESSGFGVAPTDGNYQAALETLDLDTGASGSELETFLGLSSGSLTNLGAIEGSAIKQTITVGAGDTLNFDWNFLTDDLPNLNYNDFAFFSITNVKQLADTFSPTNFSFSHLYDETGYQTYTYNFQSAGTYTLGFGVVDVGDDTVNSALLVDNVKLTKAYPVPEPMSILSTGIVLGFGVLFTKEYSNRGKNRTNKA
ncbi:MAG: PEP-CTERM sorting domain-containing protein [Calothrix sp. MO_192.B10]|nr:PEP-CTERM sorting domain-containing protein [Calothrix sp. MO_192.B10]